MAKELQLRQESGWMVVSSTPDVCRTPIGSSVVPVPYMIVAQLINAVKVSKNVRANGNPVVLHQSVITKTMGDEAGVLKGLSSKIHIANNYPDEGSSSVRINGKKSIRKKDKIYMNSHSDSKGNTFGKVS